MRNQHKDDFVFAMLGVGLRKQILQNGYGSEAGNTAQRPGLLVFEDAAQKVYFTIFQTDFMLDLALANNRLVDAADIYARSHRRDIERHLQRNLPARVNAR